MPHRHCATIEKQGRLIERALVDAGGGSRTGDASENIGVARIAAVIV
jgi:hypothetical protein